MSRTTYIRRTYLDRIRQFIGKDLIKVITGMRRTGKSVIMDQLIEGLIQDGVQGSNILKYDLESKMTPSFKDGDDLYEGIFTWAKDKGHTYIFIDEIQNIDGWQRCIRALFTDLDADIFITGSSSKLLSGELATHLAGRYVEIMVLPFSFSEIVDYNRTIGNDVSRDGLFDSYIHYGGMPLIVVNDFDPITSHSILDAMYDSVVINDIAGRKGIRNTRILKEVMSYAMSEIGHIINSSNVNNYLRSQGKNASVDSILEYLDAAEGAMFLTKVSRKDVRGRNLLKIDHKYYLTDHGMREINGMSNTASIDQILENIVFNELRRKGYDVVIGRNGDNEIDFIASKGNDLEYYQVSYLLASDPTIEREFRSLESINDNHPKFVLSMDTIDRSRNGIRHANIIDWLLSDR